MQKMFRPLLWLAGMTLMVTFASGCHLRSRFFEVPGTFAEQRARAVVHDPFPNNDIAPPILGGRPLGYDRPSAEPEQNQFDFRSRGAVVPAYQGF